MSPLVSQISWTNNIVIFSHKSSIEEKEMYLLKNMINGTKAKTIPTPILIKIIGFLFLLFKRSSKEYANKLSFIFVSTNYIS